MSPALDALLHRYIIIPKTCALDVAALVQPHSEAGAIAIEAYPKSWHRSTFKEIGIGLALSPEKWRANWPQYQYQELEGLTTDGGLTTIDHQWSLDELQRRRNNVHSMPKGFDKEAWKLFGVDIRAHIATMDKARKQRRRDEKRRLGANGEVQP